MKMNGPKIGFIFLGLLVLLVLMVMINQNMQKEIDNETKIMVKNMPVPKTSPPPETKILPQPTKKSTHENTEMKPVSSTDSQLKTEAPIPQNLILLQ